MAKSTTKQSDDNQDQIDKSLSYSNTNTHHHNQRNKYWQRRDHDNDCDACGESDNVLLMNTRVAKRTGLYGSFLCTSCRQPTYRSHNNAAHLNVSKLQVAIAATTNLKPTDIEIEVIEE